MPDLSHAEIGDVIRANERMTQEVLPRLGGGVELLQTDPRDDLGELDDQRGEQTITMLRLLGYLSDPPGREAGAPGTAWLWTGNEIARAWAEWKADRISTLETTGPTMQVDLGEKPRSEVWTSESLRRDLKACSSLEGEVSLTRWPQVGVVSLASRIVLMRLRLFGLWSGTAADPMPAGADQTLAAQAERIAAGMGLGPVDLVNRLGDIEGLSVTIVEQLRDRWAVLRAPGQPGYAVEVARLVVDDHHPIKALNLKNERMADWNRFAIRLLQVRLWTLGYYPGEVDGIWTSLSAKALADFLRDYEVRHEERIVGSIKGGWVVLDLAGVLQHFVEQVDTPARSLERSAIDERLNDPRALENPELWSKLAEAHERERTASADGAPLGAYEGDSFRVFGASNLRRKRYCGWRGIFAAFGRLLRKAASSIRAFVDGLIRAIRKGLGYARNIVRYVVDSTRAAARVIGLALQRLHCWLTGTPVVTSSASGAFGMATYWQHDFDTINVVDRRCAAEVCARHLQTLDWMQRSVGIMLRIATEVVHLVLAVGNWLLLAWRAVRLVREIVREAKDPLFAEILAAEAAT